MTILITIGSWHDSRIRAIGNVVDSITEPRKKTIKINFYDDIQKIQIYSRILLVIQNTTLKAINSN